MCAREPELFITRHTPTPELRRLPRSRPAAAGPPTMGLHTILKKIKLKVSARGALLEETEPVYSDHFFAL